MTEQKPKVTLKIGERYWIDNAPRKSQGFVVLGAEYLGHLKLNGQINHFFSFERNNQYDYSLIYQQDLSERDYVICKDNFIKCEDGITVRLDFQVKYIPESAIQLLKHKLQTTHEEESHLLKVLNQLGAKQ